MENEKPIEETTPPAAEDPNPLITENEDLKQRLQAGEERIAILEKSLEEKSGALTSAEKSLEEAKQVIVETSVDLAQAVSAYRLLAGQANPGPVAEMISGDTIAEIDASVKNARTLVEKVRRDIESGSAGLNVPAGAPPRVMPDPSALTARDKIKMAVEGR